MIFLPILSVIELLLTLFLIRSAMNCYHTGSKKMRRASINLMVFLLLASVISSFLIGIFYNIIFSGLTVMAAYRLSHKGNYRLNRHSQAGRPYR